LSGFSAEIEAKALNIRFQPFIIMTTTKTLTVGLHEDPKFKPAKMTSGLAKCAEQSIEIHQDAYPDQMAFKLVGITLVKHAP
jgi:hypothetical protein